MSSFKTRIRQASRTGGPIILANDYPSSARNLEKRTVNNIRKLHNHICGIKLNLHLLLPLGGAEIKRITRTARNHGLVTIADIKLNDIGNTNAVATERLWDLGFDAVIVNPIMGPDGLRALTESAHKSQNGVIALCHMSAPGARLAYDLGLESAPSRLYRLFLKWAVQAGADGVVAGATFPDIIRYCKRTARGMLDIYSPGVGVQGGDLQTTISAGTDYVIVGRSIINAKNPLAEAKKIHELIPAR